jgi:dolichol-phosphate mannosyltransferase
MSMKLSVVIPAYNEERNIVACIKELQRVLRDKYQLAHEVLVVNDNSQDATEELVLQEMKEDPSIRLVKRRAPGGFGRAIRAGLDAVRGDVVVIYMADLSDDPEDVVAYYRKIEEGYDCVYGSRFIKGSQVTNYPRLKLIVNRIVNFVIRILFWTRFNDLTNAFKAYRTEVIRDCGPFRASHFNLTIEMSLSALIRRYHIAQIPIRWYGRTAGVSTLNLRQMGRRYLSTLVMLFFQRILIADDLMAERLVSDFQHKKHVSELEARVRELELRFDMMGCATGTDTANPRNTPKATASANGPDAPPRQTLPSDSTLTAR